MTNPCMHFRQTNPTLLANVIILINALEETQGKHEGGMPEGDEGGEDGGEEGKRRGETQHHNQMRQEQR